MTVRRPKFRPAALPTLPRPPRARSLAQRPCFSSAPNHTNQERQPSAPRTRPCPPCRTWVSLFYVRRSAPLGCSGFWYLECCGELRSVPTKGVYRNVLITAAPRILLRSVGAGRKRGRGVARRQRLSRGRVCGGLGIQCHQSGL